VRAKLEAYTHDVAMAATGVKMWAKINPRGGGGNESPWLISLYSVHMHPHTHICQQLLLWLPFPEIYNGLKENI
jgi:hypothetical protein